MSVIIISPENIAKKHLTTPHSLVLVDDTNSSLNAVNKKDDYSFFDCTHLSLLTSTNDFEVIVIDGCTLPPDIVPSATYPNTNEGLSEMEMDLSEQEEEDD